MKNQAYKQFDVWRRTPLGEARSYRCFEGVSDGLFYIQSCDAYRSGEHETHLQLAEQLIELFCEVEPSARISGFPSLQEALDSFDAEFEIEGDE